MGRPRISVIIASYNRCGDLERVLDAIYATEYPDLEVIVVDNASTDSAPQVAQSFLGVRWIRNEQNRGFSEANNQGLALATGQYVVLLNNDAVVGMDWFQRLVDFLEAHPEAAAAGGKAYFWSDANPVGNSRNSYFAHTVVDPDSGWNQAMIDAPDGVRGVATLSGCAVMIRKEAIDDVGGPFLEPAFFTYYEETDFFARAIRRGWKLFYVSEAAVWHRVRALGEDATSYQYHVHMERNRIRYVFRNFEEKELKQVEDALNRAIARNAWRHLFRNVSRMSAERRARREALAWYRSHRAELLEERARLSCGERVPYNSAVRALQRRVDPVLSGMQEDACELVSIIIPNYNYGRFLGEAIESALGQTHPRVEVIVVDDGSTDDSLEVARRYPVTVISQENRGVGAARNRGTSIAKGSHFVFLDSDDLLEPTYVARVIEVLREQKAFVAYAYTGMRYFGTVERVYCSYPFDPERLLVGNYVHASALVRRSAFEAVGGFDPTWRLGHEDYELWVRMLHHGFHGVHIPEPLLNYRHHGSSRNLLSRRQDRELRWRMRLTYPRFYWRKLLKDPIRTIQFLIRSESSWFRRREGRSALSDAG